MSPRNAHIQIQHRMLRASKSPIYVPWLTGNSLDDIKDLRKDGAAFTKRAREEEVALKSGPNPMDLFGQVGYATQNNSFVGFKKVPYSVPPPSSSLEILILSVFSNTKWIITIYVNYIDNFIIASKFTTQVSQSCFTTPMWDDNIRTCRFILRWSELVSQCHWGILLSESSQKLDRSKKDAFWPIWFRNDIARFTVFPSFTISDPRHIYAIFTT